MKSFLDEIDDIPENYSQHIPQLHPYEISDDSSESIDPKKLTQVKKQTKPRFLGSAHVSRVPSKNVFRPALFIGLSVLIIVSIASGLFFGLNAQSLIGLAALSKKTVIAVATLIGPVTGYIAGVMTYLYLDEKRSHADHQVPLEFTHTTNPLQFQLKSIEMSAYPEHQYSLNTNNNTLQTEVMYTTPKLIPAQLKN